MASRVFSQHLDRDKPLWELWAVEGLEDGRWALLSKVHHCMVDGVAATDLMSVMFSDTTAGKAGGGMGGRTRADGAATAREHACPAGQPGRAARRLSGALSAPADTARSLGREPRARSQPPLPACAPWPRRR